MGTTPQVKALNCPNCGAALVIRGLATTVTVVCEHCLTVLDAKDPNLAVLQKFQDRQRVQPRIPLGTRGKGGIGEVPWNVEVRLPGSGWHPQA